MLHEVVTKDGLNKDGFKGSLFRHVGILLLQCLKDQLAKGIDLRPLPRGRPIALRILNFSL